MSKNTELLDKERDKLEWLRSKVLLQEKKVQILEEISNDPLDAAFESECGKEYKPTVNASTPAFDMPSINLVPPQSSIWSVSNWSKRARAIPPHWVQILKFIGRDGKPLAEVEQFVKALNSPLSPGAVRTGLMNYRKEFSFIENPQKGFYLVTEIGMEAIKGLENESPATNESNGAIDVESTQPSETAT